MPFRLLFTPESEQQINTIQLDTTKKAVKKAVEKALGFIEVNPKHPSLHSHSNDSYPGPPNTEVWQSYAQNKTPGAYRIFWYYGPKRGDITILGIIPHPNDH